MISILGKHYYEFPRPFKLELKLKDMLESEVDEKYYLSDKLISKIVSWNARQKPFEKVLGNNSISPTLTARGAGEEHSGMVLYANELDNTTNLQNYALKIKEATKKGYAEASDGDGVYINRPHQKRGVVQKDMIPTIKANCGDVGVVVVGNYSPSNHNASRIVDTEGLAPTVMENHGTVTAIVENNEYIGTYNYAIEPKVGIVEQYTKLRIRKLTPKECWRLMGFTDESFDKAEKVNSNAQLYKQAGNSIVVTVLMNIFKELL